MSEIAWISLAVIAVCILLAIYVLRRKDAFIQLPIPKCKKPLVLSPNDAKRIIALQNQEITLEIIKVLAKYNTPERKPDVQELQQIPEKVLRFLAEGKLIEPPSPDITDISEFELGYVGRQFLEAEFEGSELIDPVSWHEEILRA